MRPLYIRDSGIRFGERLVGKTCGEQHIATVECQFGRHTERSVPMDGLVEEGQEIIKEYKGSPALDPGLLAAAQAVEHYEISRYGTLRTWANELRLKDAVRLLEQTLQEEKNTDATLTKIAENVGNHQPE